MDRFPFQFSDTVGCPLGRILYSGLKWDSDGAPWLSPMRVNDMHLLVYTLEGEARYLDETGRDLVMGEGSLVLVPPGLAHAYPPAPGAPWSELHFWLDGPLWHMLGEMGAGQPSVLFLEARPAAYWLKRFLDALAPDGPQHVRASWQRLSGVQSVLADMLAAQPEAEAAGPAKEMPWLTKARAMLEQGQLCEPTLADVARHIGMGYESFRKRFTREVGVTPGRYRSRQLIRRACQLLAVEGFSVHEVADRLGFADAFHFSRRFKATMGVSPSRLLQKHHEDPGALYTAYGLPYDAARPDDD